MYARGNEKTAGRPNSTRGGSYTWSRSPGVTCPGASDWCELNCYARKFSARWANVREAWARNDGPRVESLPTDCRLLRLHVSGDFDTAPYIRAWARELSRRPDVKAWAYTRAWAVPRLWKALQVLRAVPTLQLFASCDPTMPTPPEGWRVAWIRGDPRAKGLVCPHQQGAVESCLVCGYCFEPRQGDVVFIPHK